MQRCTLRRAREKNQVPAFAGTTSNMLHGAVVPLAVMPSSSNAHNRRSDTFSMT
jgi:hypothetical protein